MKHPASLDQPSPHVLNPWHPKEAFSVTAAADFLGMSEATVRRLAARLDLGCKLGGEWRLSRVACRMFAERDEQALHLYLKGDRTDPRVRDYFRREGVPVDHLPHKA